MRLTLEKRDLVEILGAFFKQNITEKSIDFEDNPFGIVVCGMSVRRMVEMAAILDNESTFDPGNPKELEDSSAIGQETPSVEESEGVILDEDGVENVWDASALLNASKTLAEQPTKAPTPRGQGTDGIPLDPSELTGK